MADRLSAYADWLVANQNKRGTPEFETVANSYKQLRSQGASAPQAPDDSLMTGMANSALRAAGGITDVLPTAAKALTGYENPRIQIPEDPEGFMGFGMPRIVDASDPRLEGAKSLIPGMEGNEFEKAADKIYEVQKSLNYQPKVPWEQVKANPSAENVLGFMGEAAVTSLPDMAMAMVSAPAYFATYVAPIANKRAENDGRSQPSPADLAYAVAASIGIATAERVGAKAVLSKGAGNALTRPLKAGATEAVTEGIQNPLEYAGQTVNTQAGFDPAVAADQALAGMVGGAGAGTGIRGTLEVGGALLPGETTPTDNEAAADLATRLQGIADANKLNMKDIEKTSTKGAREAVDKAHVQIASEMNQLRDDLKKLLKVDRLDPIDVVVDKVSAEAAHREARNKTKNTVGKQEMDATERLVGNTREGQELLKLYRQMNELTELHNAGYIGGLSQYTDQVSPFSSNVGYTARSAAELPTRLLATGLAGATLSPAVPAAQLATVGAGRFADAVTGRRSRVRKYMRDNAGKQGVPVNQSLVSVREQAIAEDEQRKREEDRLREIMLERGNPPKGDPNDPNPSPEYVMQSTTGLNREGVDKALGIIEKEVPELRSSVKAYRKMLRKGTEVPNLNFLIQEVKGTANRNPQEFPDRKAPQPGTIGANERPGYLRGIESNRKFIEEQKRKVNEDTALSGFDRKVALDAIEDLEKNLGSDPQAKAEQVMRKALASARDKNKVSEHVLPYVLRVTEQQKAKRQKNGEVFGEIDFPQEIIRNEDGLLKENTDYEIQIMQAANQLNNALQAQQTEKDKWALVQSVMREGVKRLDPEGRETISQIQIGLKGGKGVSAEELARLTPMFTNAFRYLTKETAPTWVDQYAGVYTPDRTIMVRPLAPSIVKTFSIDDVEFDPQKGILDNRPLSPHNFMRVFAHELSHAIEDQSGLRDVLKAMKKVTDWNYELSEKASKDTKVPSYDYRKPDEIIDEVGTNFTKSLPSDYKEKMQLLSEAVTLSTNFRPRHWSDLSSEIRKLEQAMSSKLLVQLPTDEFGFPTAFDQTDQNLPIYGPAILSALNLDFLEIMENEGSLGLSPSKEKRLRTAMNKVRDKTLYLYSAAELGADAVAHYMVYPEETKRMAPNLAKVIRKAVNESSVRHYLTFHSLAGLLGAAGLSAAVQAVLSGEDDEERPGILASLQSPGLLQQTSM